MTKMADSPLGAIVTHAVITSDAKYTIIFLNLFLKGNNQYITYLME